MVPSAVTNVIAATGVIGMIQFCKGCPFLFLGIFAALLLSWTLKIYVTDVIGVIKFSKGVPFLLLWVYF